MPRKKIYPDDEMVAFSIRIPVSMRARLEVLAGKNRRSLNQELLWRLEQALKNADSDSQKAGPQDLN